MSKALRTTPVIAALAAVAAVLAACGTAGPPHVTYVLGTPAPASASVEPLAGRPLVEVRPVRVPDYLDMTDILVRKSTNEMAPSPTGRWGERLSVGVTRALTLDLARQLPGFNVAAIEEPERPARLVLADVESFEPRADGSVILVARWRVLDGAGRTTLAGERVALTEPVAGPGDAAIVAAMTRAVEAFAARVADGVRGTMRHDGR